MPSNEAVLLQPVEPPRPTLVPSKAQGTQDRIRRQLLLESEAMAAYAFSAGLELPPELLHSLSTMMAGESQEEQEVGSVSLEEMGLLHGQLAAVVAPALPQTIYLLQRDRARDSWLSVLGPLPTVRRLTLAACFFTLTFVMTSLSGDVNVVTMGSDIYRMEGWMLLQVLVFLMSAAGVGATFHALFTAHSFIAKGTYDPRCESSYWTQIGLGVIAGLVLSQVIPIGSETMAGVAMLPSNAEALKELSNHLDMMSINVSGNPISKPVLALVGGFSATLVYTVMQRFVSTLESVFKNSGSD
jgi:hypothetical protein